jgi:salicylate hydroxylase
VLTRQALHLPDGPEQAERDKLFAADGKCPDLWVDEDWQDFMWGVDVMKEVEHGWDDLVGQFQEKGPG